MDKKKNSAFSRRDFLTKTAVAGLGTTALVADQAGAQVERQWHHTADFISVGAGVSGLAGAVSALDHGASVKFTLYCSDTGW